MARLPPHIVSRILSEANRLRREEAAIAFQRFIRRRMAMNYARRNLSRSILFRSMGSSSSRARRLALLTRHGRGGRYNWGT